MEVIKLLIIPDIIILITLCAIITHSTTSMVTQFDLADLKQETC